MEYSSGDALWLSASPETVYMLMLGLMFRLSLTLQEAVGKHNVYAFTIGRLPFGLPANQSYHTQAWMFDAYGEKIQTN